MKKENIKKIVKESYEKMAESNGCCCSCGCNPKGSEEIAKTLGYSEQEINVVPDANLGLGCGNPTVLDKINEGMTVLDLGSGAGFDCFLASKKVGMKGKVIGVDMTEKMIKKAKENAKKYGYNNVEFRLGDIEELPVEDNSVDIIISNCVINLAPDKPKVFSEACRVLKESGKLVVSDIVLLKELSQKDMKDEELIAGCVGGAVLKDEYIEMIKKAGFEIKEITEDTDISKRQYNQLPVESLKLVAYKK